MRSHITIHLQNWPRGCGVSLTRTCMTTVAQRSVEGLPTAEAGARSPQQLPSIFTPAVVSLRTWQRQSQPAHLGGPPPQTYPSGGLPDSCCRGAAQWAAVGNVGRVETEAALAKKPNSSLCLWGCERDTSERRQIRHEDTSLLCQQGSFFGVTFLP